MAAISVVFSGRKIGTYQVDASPFIVGRDASCHVPIENVGVSRRHCQFIFDDEDGRYYVQDLGSSNGTFLNGDQVRRAPVDNGDKVTIGKYVLVFENNLMEFLSQGGNSGGAGAAPRAAPSAPGMDAMLTFRMDPETMRAQIGQAGTAASSVSDQVRRAGDVAKQFDPDAPLVIKERKRLGRYVAAAVKLLGLAIIISGILIAILYAVSRGG